ncbi:MAG: hypothetical protein J6S85_14110 [Methanobrevibacter sp.]|nr:hypothetical protein [Methanobrevibacter sp.]
MADYIRRDIVLKIINTVNDTGGFAGYADYCVLFDEIDTMPAADVQPIRRGKWIIDKDFYTCSRCNHQYLIDKILSMTIYPSGGMPYYCPCCGADMREPETTKG